MKTEDALNLRPGDEVKIDGNWWIVTEHRVTIADPAPVTMQLHSCDREFFTVIACGPSMQFEYEPR